MSQKISDLRAELDVLDTALAALLAQRFALTDEIGRVKRAEGLTVRDGTREAEVLERVTQALPDPSLRPEVSMVYEAIFAASRRRQESL